MKTTGVIIISISVLFILVFILFFFDNTLFEPLVDVQTPSVPSVNITTVDLSGGITDVQYVPDTPVNQQDDTIRYNPDNFDLTYHDLNKYAGLYETNLKNIRVWDASSNSLVNLPYAPVQNLPVYYDIEKKVYGPFRPTYEDSVLLSYYHQPL